MFPSYNNHNAFNRRAEVPTDGVDAIITFRIVMHIYLKWIEMDN